jgi:hypothetical protein
MKKLNTCASILLLILALLYTVFGMSQTNNTTSYLPSDNKTGTSEVVKSGYIPGEIFLLQADKSDYPENITITL